MISYQMCFQFVNSFWISESLRDPRFPGLGLHGIERIVFRTGPYRGYTDALFAEQGAPSAGALTIEDLPASGTKVAPCVYWIDNVKINKIE